MNNSYLKLSSDGKTLLGLSCDSLTSVTIPNSVTSIGVRAFDGCSRLTSITIPNSVTSIEGDAFRYCSSLTSITIPNSVTTIGRSAFWGCSGLKSVTIGNSVTSIGCYAFWDCSGLTSITIPNSVTEIEDDAFDGCSGLTSIRVEDGNTKYDSRDNCNAIIETTTNTLIRGCQNTIIPNSVTSIGDYAFWGCSGLTSITIPNSVSEIGDGAFDNCSALASIVVTEGNPNFSSGDGVLFNKNKTTLIRYPIGQTKKTYTIPNSVSEIGYGAFDDCSALASIVVAEGNPNYSSEDGVLFNKNKTKLIKYPLGKTQKEYVIPNSVTNIGEGAFDSCEHLESISIPNNVTIIEEFAFHNCKYTSIEIPSSLVEIGEDAFDGFFERTIYVPYGQKERFIKMDALKNLVDLIEEMPKNGVMVDYTCFSCGKTLSSDFAFCPYCGAAQSRKCPVCGATNLPVDACFCPECGTKL